MSETTTLVRDTAGFATEVQELAHILTQHWAELAETGHSRDSYTTVATERERGNDDYALWSVITQAPSGRYYLWKYVQAIPKDLHSRGPADLNGDERLVALTSVRPVPHSTNASWEPAVNGLGDTDEPADV